MRIAKQRRETPVRRGLTLVNTMVAVAIIAVAILGSSHTRYSAALHSRRAASQVTAARAASLLCESWRALKGTETYDPRAYFSSELGIVTHATVVPLPSEGGFTRLGSYKLLINDADYYATLSWKDVDTGLRAFNVAVAWAQQEQGQGPEEADAVFRLTTYAITQ